MDISVGQNLDLVCKPIIYYRNSAAAKAPKPSVHSVIPTPLRVDAGGEESLVVTPSDWVVSTKDFVEEASLLAGKHLLLQITQTTTVNVVHLACTIFGEK